MGINGVTLRALQDSRSRGNSPGSIVRIKSQETEVAPLCFCHYHISLLITENGKASLYLYHHIIPLFFLCKSKSPPTVRVITINILALSSTTYTHTRTQTIAARANYWHWRSFQLHTIKCCSLKGTIYATCWYVDLFIYSLILLDQCQ